MTEAIKTSLVKKLAEVMGAVERVAKSGHNTFFHYDYATEADITAAVRKELAIRGVMLVPSVGQVDWADVTTAKGGKERLCTMRVLFTILDGDSDERITMEAIGQGQDSGDKASYKAITGATKYALLKLFLIPTGDDPEEEKPRQQLKPPPPPKPPAPRPVDTSKLVAAFAGLGVTPGQLEDRIRKPLSEATDADVAALREYHKQKKALAAETAEQLAKRLEQEKAEAGIAAEAAKKPGKDPRFVAFEALVDRIRAATTPAAVTLVHAEAAKEKLFQPGDLKALQRTATDRCLVLEDAAKFPKPRKMEIQDAQSPDVPF